MSDTVQIPEFGEWQVCPICAGVGEINNPYMNVVTAPIWIPCTLCLGNKIIQRPILKLQSFRKKLENITIDELLKNTGIILELFDEHFK